MTDTHTPGADQAAALANDKRSLAFYETLDGTVLVYPDLAAGLRDWVKEVQKVLRGGK